MNELMTFLRPVASFLMRRSVFFLLSAASGYAFGYHHADQGEPSLLSRVQSIGGADHVRDDNMRRQRAVEALRQARMDSIDAMIPH